MELWSVAQNLKEQNQSFSVVTLVNVLGSAPQDVGAKMIVTSEGLHWGTIGGGKVELAAIKKCQEFIEQKKSSTQLIKWNLQLDIGMSCGGVVEILFETFQHSIWPIVIFGAGHVSQALTRLLKNLDCDVTCIDSREDWVNRLEGVRKICHPNPKELVKTLDPKSFFLCMTMGHAYDVPILGEISKLAPNSPYVGVIGSDIKGKKIKAELKELGSSDEFVQKLRVPIGLPLGTNHPYEIAISISAELIQVRDQLK